MKINKMHNSGQSWYKLDNAAKIFPSIISSELTSVFRISAILKFNVKIKQLYEAVDTIKDRFPYFKVQLKKGFFWYYLDPNPAPIAVIPENKCICKGFEHKKRFENLFRILVYKNRISVEFLHIITDGGGGLEFLKTLITTYFEKCNIPITDWGDVLKPDKNPHPEESEDGYNRFFQKKIPVPSTLSKAFHLPFNLRKKPRFQVLNLIVPVEDIICRAKKYEVSITVYLVSVYLYILQKIFYEIKNKGRRRLNWKIRVQMPVNLRNIYPSKTMRNFALFILPEIDLRLGEYSFEEILKTVYHFVQVETDQKLVNKMITKNVRNEKITFIRIMPRLMKNFILSIAFYIRGARQYSGVLTNLGKVILPKEVLSNIDYFSFTAPPPNKSVKINMGVISINNKLVISIGSICKSLKFHQYFVDFLTKEGIKIKLSKYMEDKK